ncbi:MAG: ferrous iron transport protein B [Schleiferiaceae bacterium]
MGDSKRSLRIAFVGNPNTGKSSLFNALTGLNQKVSNYPGITVEKKLGKFNIDSSTSVEVIDLPGTYSLNPSSLDEAVVLNYLAQPNPEEKPDGIVVVLDATNLKRNLYLLSQVLDLGYPTISVLNMMDRVERKGITIDIEALESIFDIPFVAMSTRKTMGFDELKSEITDIQPIERASHFSVSNMEWVSEVKEYFGETSDYAAWLLSVQETEISRVSENAKDSVQRVLDVHKVNKNQQRTKEAIYRYQRVNKALDKAVVVDPSKDKSLSARIDRVLTHKVWGLLILFAVLAVIFQAVFAWASVPMDYIDLAFSKLSQYVSNSFPAGPLTDLLSEGIIPGLGGVVIFIPQIAILFTFIGILEESGYMARVVVLMDKIMNKFGLSGKSVVPLISGTACAIPAIMASRTIDSWKERLITIFVTPFTTCSARLPVYIVLISLVIPEGSWLGFGYRGLALLAMYLLGFATALLSSYVMSKWLGTSEKAPFILEMPSYRAPLPRNLFLTVYEKSKSFVVNAGKIILAISVLLWVLATNGPSSTFGKSDNEILAQTSEKFSGEEAATYIESYRLENSYIGYMGKFIEPAIEPLGYDWKVGIALITSFAAREVFVGTIATIYSVGDDNEETIINKMRQEVNPKTGLPFFSLPVGMSLLIFYAFAMQCVSTFAVVRKETNSWTWPLLQLVFMTTFAYVMSFATYQLLS